MSKISKENIKRLLNKTTTSPDEDGDLLTKGYGVAGISGDISGTQGVAVVNAGGGAIEIGLGAITPTSVAAVKSVTATSMDVANNVVASGILVEQSATFNKVTPSGVGAVAPIPNCPSGIGAVGCSEWLEVTVNGNVRHIPLYS